MKVLGSWALLKKNTVLIDARNLSGSPMFRQKREWLANL